MPTPAATADDITTEIKTLAALTSTEFKVLDEDAGIVETIVSVTGIKDQVDDIIEPGAYADTLATRLPLGVWGHDWKQPVSKPIEVKELLPGDSGLPAEMSPGVAWPAEAGALVVKAQYNLDTETGRDAYTWAKFLGDAQGWSIGYGVPAGQSETKDGTRHIKGIELYEYSQVLHGAMPVSSGARTLSVKDVREHYEDFPALSPDQAKGIEDFLAPAMNDGDLAAVRTFLKARIDPNHEPAAVELKTVEVKITSEYDADEDPEIVGVVLEDKGVYVDVPESMEHRIRIVEMAVSATNDEGFFVYSVATFDDRVLVQVTDWRMDDGRQRSFFEVPYTIGGDNEVTFGEPVAVTVMASVEAKSEVDELRATVATLEAKVAALMTSTTSPNDDTEDKSSNDNESDDESDDGDVEVKDNSAAVSTARMFLP